MDFQNVQKLRLRLFKSQKGDDKMKLKINGDIKVLVCKEEMFSLVKMKKNKTMRKKLIEVMEDA